MDPIAVECLQWPAEPFKPGKKTERMDVAVKIPEAEKALRLKGQTLRLSPEAWLNLKLLAAILDGERGSRVTQHDVLLEAVEDLFQKYRKHLPVLGH